MTGFCESLDSYRRKKKSTNKRWFLHNLASLLWDTKGETGWKGSWVKMYKVLGLNYLFTHWHTHLLWSFMNLCLFFSVHCLCFWYKCYFFYFLIMESLYHVGHSEACVSWAAGRLLPLSPQALLMSMLIIFEQAPAHALLKHAFHYWLCSVKKCSPVQLWRHLCLIPVVFIIQYWGK